MNPYTLDWKEYADTAREAAAEGCVLLCNENHALPLVPGDTAAVFGRIQLNYYRSGTGSGGMVNVPYVRSLTDGLREYESQNIQIYEPLLSCYREWEKEHPFDQGSGWGTEPWCQQEMHLTDEILADAAAHCSIALIVLGRTAGEDRDNTPQPGSYYLTEEERDMLGRVCKAFPRTAVILNTGNIIDMSWVEEFRPSAVLYIWQGGMEGGSGAADVLCGKVSPSGKLSDTIARELSDYPSMRNFGSDTANFYQEDIYVGYRYFETFAKDRVLWPFGFGLSYTEFQIKADMAPVSVQPETAKTTVLTVTASVQNTGSRDGKEVVQVYCCPPQGTLGKPLRSLCAFAKTRTLAPGEAETLTLTIPLSELASYDDSGSCRRSCFVLEAGTYRIYAGTDVRSAACAGSFSLAEPLILSECTQALAPTAAFERFRPCPVMEESLTGNGSPAEADGEAFSLAFEPVPLRSLPAAKEDLSCAAYTGDCGLLLSDVAAGRTSMEEFLAQLSDQDLTELVRGEGMCSPKVTPGTAAAFGGITERLRKFGIPAGCCSDGPSGIRMDCGASAFGLPNGTLLACTFNVPLVTRLFAFEGLELYANQIDSLLGPGINIHRNPLNGRNFEYHSEDPYLTGCMAQAQLAGMDQYGVSGTMKHFCANNQEYHRHTVNSIVSERALREIYLKPFEMGVRGGHTRSIMTTYGPVNGIWTAGNYDLNTRILRGEWKYQGLVMTDWWAKINEEGKAPDRKNLAAMIRAQNDLYMVTPDARAYPDNLTESLERGTLTRGELVRSAANICGFLLASPAMERSLGTYHTVVHKNAPGELTLLSGADMESCTVAGTALLSLEDRRTDAGSAFLIALTFAEEGIYNFSLTASSDGSELSQMAVTLTMDSTVLHTFSYHGTEHRVKKSREKEVRGTTHYLKFFFSQSGLKLHTLAIEKISPLPAGR